MIGRVRKLLSLLTVAVVARVSGCADATVGQADRFTQAGVSMEPTVKGQVITVRAVGRDYSSQRGDIVLFHAEGGQWGDTTKPLLKRVISVGGETISCCDPKGRVYVNSTPLDEPYVVTDAPLTMPSPATLRSTLFRPYAGTSRHPVCHGRQPREVMTRGVLGRYQRHRCSPSCSPNRHRESTRGVPARVARTNGTFAIGCGAAELTVGAVPAGFPADFPPALSQRSPHHRPFGPPLLCSCGNAVAGRAHETFAAAGSDAPDRTVRTISETPNATNQAPNAVPPTSPAQSSTGTPGSVVETISVWLSR
jgi:signal peptidase I